MKKVIFLLLGQLLLATCQNHTTENILFDKFQAPDANARPMVRWWWNGNCIENDEIKREIAVLKNAGIGGVEINSIAMPDFAAKTDIPGLEWAGPEWCDRLKTACDELKKNGMITDLIVGSGWPFGGRFLKENEIMQRLSVKKKTVPANTIISLNIEDFLKEPVKGELDKKDLNTEKNVIKFVKLVPEKVNTLNDIIDLTQQVKSNHLNYKTGNRNYTLVVVYLQTGFSGVQNGAPGADGPVMDHFNPLAVAGYLDRLKKIEKETGVPLSEIIRALFCDSIELDGANWTDDMGTLFKEKNGYEISPYLAFVIQPPKGFNKLSVTPEFADTIKRVQYDFYNTLVDVFLDRFVLRFQKFCTENNVLCRYQAYGYPWYMGVLEGYLIPDIPESNSWLNPTVTPKIDEDISDEFSWSQPQGYMLWNKMAASGAHLKNRKIVSCESMTNTRDVFKTSLETIKQADDMNFITGINYSVLHGFNYSPPKAGFPGWVRFGTYFSEQNTWWPYFSKWTDYNARLSSVFQNSKPTADIAIIGRVRDIWGELGLDREPFNTQPWYYARLWEPISQLGSSCDYISQSVLADATIDQKQLIYGPMKYKALIFTDVESLTPEAAIVLKKYAQAGGKVVFVGNKPSRSLSLKNVETTNNFVQKTIDEIMKSTKNVVQISAPIEPSNFIEWTTQLMNRIKLDPEVNISNPVSFLYQIKQISGEQDIFFFNNSNRKVPIEFDATFKTGNKIPYIWIPETGERFAYPYEKSRNYLHIKLDKLESALIIFKPEKIDLPKYVQKELYSQKKVLNTTWSVAFEHINGIRFHRNMDQLINFKLSGDTTLENFAGTMIYSTEFENDGKVKCVSLGEVYQAITEVSVNGKSAGVKWYGNHTYYIEDLLQPGSNHLEIKLTTTLSNYCRSLRNNSTAMNWAGKHNLMSEGLLKVELLSIK